MPWSIVTCAAAAGVAADVTRATKHRLPRLAKKPWTAYARYPRSSGFSGGGPKTRVNWPKLLTNTGVGSSVTSKPLANGRVNGSKPGRGPRVVAPTNPAVLVLTPSIARRRGGTSSMKTPGARYSGMPAPDQ
jgi:hypothetical protein